MIKNAFLQIRKLLSFLPLSCNEMPPVVISNDDPGRENEMIDVSVPANPRKAYDMHAVITTIADDGDFLEVKKRICAGSHRRIFTFGRP